MLVSFEYLALADSAAAAEDMVHDVLANEDASEEMTARATMLRDPKGRYPLPEGYDGRSLVYGDAQHRLLDLLIAEERRAVETAGGGE